MYRTEVKFDSLSDSDRSGTKYQNFLLAAGLFHFILTAVYGIVIRCLCREFCRTGIDHLIGCNDSVFMAHVMDLALTLSGQARDHIVREFDSFCFF